jgi:anthranilate synthase/aminodeoxychorismate synthase-like glutamine amidotransferase
MEILLIDNYDSFTYMLADYLATCGANCEVVRNDDPLLLAVDASFYAALVISPGPGKPQDAGYLMQVLPHWIGKVPILGVCLGQQAIGLHFGASLEKLDAPRHGKIDPMRHTGGVLFKDISENFFATRYHSLVVRDLPPVLRANCFHNHEVMALEHLTLPIYGLQFHPESCTTQFGLQIVKNFIELLK